MGATSRVHSAAYVVRRWFRLWRISWSRKDKKAGKIINIGSMCSFFGSGLIPSYSVAKGAIIQFPRWRFRRTHSCARPPSRSYARVPSQRADSCHVPSTGASNAGHRPEPVQMRLKGCHCIDGAFSPTDHAGRLRGIIRQYKQEN